MKYSLFFLISILPLVSCTRLQEDTQAVPVTTPWGNASGDIAYSSIPAIQTQTSSIEEKVIITYENIDSVIREVWSGAIWEPSEVTPNEWTRNYAYSGNTDTKIIRYTSSISYTNLKKNLQQCRDEITNYEKNQESFMFSCTNNNDLQRRINYYKKLKNKTIQTRDDVDMMIGPSIDYKSYSSGYLFLMHSPDNEDITDLLITYISLDASGENLIEYYSFLSDSIPLEVSEGVFAEYKKEYLLPGKTGYDESDLDSERYREDNKKEFEEGRFKHKAIQTWYEQAMIDIDNISDIMSSLELTPKQ